MDETKTLGRVRKATVIFMVREINSQRLGHVNEATFTLMVKA